MHSLVGFLRKYSHLDVRYTQSPPDYVVLALPLRWHIAYYPPSPRRLSLRPPLAPASATRYFPESAEGTDTVLDGGRRRGWLKVREVHRLAKYKTCAMARLWMSNWIDGEPSPRSTQGSSTLQFLNSRPNPSEMGPARPRRRALSFLGMVDPGNPLVPPQITKIRERAREKTWVYDGRHGGIEPPGDRWKALLEETIEPPF